MHHMWWNNKETLAGSSFKVMVLGQILETKQSGANQILYWTWWKCFLIIHHVVAQHHLCSALDCWVSSAPSFDATVAHGLGLAHPLADHFEGNPLVRCDTVVIRAQVGLNLLPHLLLGVQLLVWFTCNHKVCWSSCSGSVLVLVKVSHGFSARVCRHALKTICKNTTPTQTVPVTHSETQDLLDEISFFVLHVNREWCDFLSRSIKT